MCDANKKAGIVTLYGRFNYGNRLQNYAAVKIWETLGFEAETLVLADRPNALRSVKRFARECFCGKSVDPEDLMSSSRLQAFDSFNDLIPTRHIRSLDGIKDEYDYFSVGSDQVWNPGMIAYNEDWYYLQFANRSQRVTFAPSIGLDNLNRKQMTRLAKGVKSFDRVSVREKRGADLIKVACGVDARVVCDPTLVLSAQSWRSVASASVTPESQYVFTYLLGGETDDSRNVLEAVAGNNETLVVPLSDREKQDEPPAGPAEFIDLIDNASHVVTDSFHAAVFASILDTPLTIVKRSGGGMFSRLETLTEKLGIEHKVYGGPSFNFDRASDNSGVAERISEESEFFTRYLRECVNA